jgi:hypothetical protein
MMPWNCCFTTSLRCQDHVISTHFTNQLGKTISLTTNTGLHVVSVFDLGPSQPYASGEIRLNAKCPLSKKTKKQKNIESFFSLFLHKCNKR